MANETEIIRQAMSILGKRRTPAKAAAARINAQKARPNRKSKPLSELACNCGATSDETHKTSCPRGRAYRRRQHTPSA